MNDLNAAPGSPFPEKLRLSLVSLAEAARLIGELAEENAGGRLPLYLVREYRFDIEDLLVDLLVTVVPSRSLVDGILADAGATYLRAKVDDAVGELVEGRTCPGGI